MIKWLFGITAAAVTALVAAFAYLNAEPVQINLYFQSLELPVAMVVALAFAIGVVLALIVFMPRVFMRNRRIARLERALQQSSDELDKLRRVPMKDVE